MVTALGVAGCSSSVEPPQPDAETCTMGAFWGDCGCEGEPKLACTDDERGSCRWFVGGCVPVGYEASPCKAKDICCVDDWPFEERTGWDTFKQLYAWGLEPWDTEREMNVSVQVDPRLVVEEMGWTCPEGGGPAICSSEPRMRRLDDGGSFSFRLGSEGLSFAGANVIIEVLRDPRATARVCMLEYTDRKTPSCQGDLLFRGRDPNPVCASDGTLTLSAMPGNAGELEDVHGTLTATFPEGVFEARF